MQYISLTKQSMLALCHAAGSLILFGCNEADIPTPRAADEAVASSEQANGASQDIPVDAVKIIKVRLVPFTNSDGWESKTVLVEWKNVGEVVVRAVDVDVLLFDRRGHRLAVIENQPIYAVSDESPGVAPGEVYEDPKDRGYIVDPTLADEARRARVNVREVVSTGAY